MVELLLLNLITNETFRKTFASPFLAEQFKKKCKYSKKLKVLTENRLY